MDIYVLSCATIESGGGIYRYELTSEGLSQKDYLPCDRPMYAVNDGKRLHVLLRAPFKNSQNSGYFSCKTDFTNSSEICDTLGKCACHIAVSAGHAYIANYLSGNIVKNCAVSRIHTGRGTNLPRQDMPHTHFVALSPDERQVFCCDLGLDTIFAYDRDLNELSCGKVPSGYGVRHFVFSEDGRNVYAVNELYPSVSVFSFDGEKLGLKHTLPLPCENKNSTAAAIRLSADGKKLYVSVRAENSIFTLQAEGERLKIVQKTSCGGNSPRDFNLFGDTLICCNETSDSVTVFKLKNGLIDSQISSVALKSPLCVL